MSDRNNDDHHASFDIAIIGLACRFPGARNAEEYWRNLCGGVESVTFFSEQELEAMGVDSAAVRSPNFVKAGALLEDMDGFDAAFFGYSPREAELLDPQQRLFLECAWHAYENAGYHPDRYEGLVGVYAGTSLSTYLLFNILANDVDSEDDFQAMIGNDKDFLSTRVSYELNLKGPSLDVQTACSTSLVAVHLACQALLSYQCDMALAGGVSVQVPQRTGYYYQEGGINSPDGHCRAFDAKANGTIFGSGVGVVTLKRLADAMAEGDTIHAIIKGSAINNDGSAKIGYIAPSIEGQAQVISMAQAVAGVDAKTIGYVEAHGTGTDLGDPVEVAALTKVFRESTTEKKFCAIGSVKTNFGHLDAAAGVAGLIKTALALKHQQIPPSLNFESPNPKIDIDESPFYVNTKLVEWKASATPRRAGVSSFGIGGTNAHLILEEAPPLALSSQSRPAQLLLLSAKTETALEVMTAELNEHLKQAPEINPADLAYTLQLGRKPFNHRRLIVGGNREELTTALDSLDPQRVLTTYQEPVRRSIVFMFPGGGAQYVNMASGIYQHEPVFRERLDFCLDWLKRRTRDDIRDCLFPAPDQTVEAAHRMRRPAVGLPALFAVEYALAKLWMSWGALPDAMIGHSLGEYVAACLAGVFTPEEALSLVLLRGQLFERLPSGAMLSVHLSESEIRAFMKETLSVAAVNGPAQCAVSGAVDAIDEMARLLAERGFDYRYLQINVAAHSHLVTAGLDEFLAFIKTINLRPPALPFISNVTGAWITAAEATDPQYWASHLRQTVRFADGVNELLREPDRILLEVGPGQTLSTLISSQDQARSRCAVFSSMRHPQESRPDMEVLLWALGKMWLLNVPVDWPRFYEAERRQRVALPAYPFERQRYWIEAQRGRNPVRIPQRKATRIADWIYLPLWKQTIPAAFGPVTQPAGPDDSWLIFVDQAGPASSLITWLRRQGHHIIGVHPGPGISRSDEESYTIDLRSPGDYVALLDDLITRKKKISRIIHAWGLTPQAESPPDEAHFQACQEHGFYSLLFLAQALSKKSVGESLRLDVISSGIHEITGREKLSPAQATLLAPCMVIPQEYPGIRCRSIDLDPSDFTGCDQTIWMRLLTAELQVQASDTVVAYRGAQRWVQVFEPLPAVADQPLCRIRDRGVYLITGGLGGVGWSLAEYLAKKVQARLILTGRSTLSEKETHDDWIASDGDQDAIKLKIKKLRALEELGAEVLYCAVDVAELEDMERLLKIAQERFGNLNGVIHAAGIAGEKSIRAIQQLTPEDCQTQFRPKAQGLFTLERLLREKELDFCLLTSSIVAVLGGIGHAAYAAANLFMDAFTRNHHRIARTPWLSVNWDVWQFTEEKGQTFNYKGNTALGETVADLAISPSEGVEVFEYLLARQASGQILVSTGDLQARFDQWIKLDFLNNSNATRTAPGAGYRRPTLRTAYIAPATEVEQTVARVWQEVLGIEQVGSRDNFFDLGGNSLLGLKVISRLKKELGIEISIVALFEGPTVQALSKILSQEESDSSSYTHSRGRGERRREGRVRKQRVIME